MSFQKNKKRKVVKLGRLELQKNTVVPISLDAAIIEFGKLNKKAYFKRLNFKYCPQCKRGSGEQVGRLPDDAINMGREDFAFEMYNLFKEFPSSSTTGHTYFVQLTQYVETLDRHNRSINLNSDNILWYCDLKESQYLNGEFKKGTIVAVYSALRAILRASGDVDLVRKIPTIDKQASGKKPHTALSDFELSRVGKKLMLAYKSYSSSVLQGNKPTQCFIINKDDIDKLTKSDGEKAFMAAKRTVNKNPSWLNQSTRIAFMITSMWTGANLGALATLKRSDVTFKKCDGDTYEFNSVKARALYQEQKLGFGFTKLTKEFIESWLIVSEKLSPNDDSPLFPFVDRSCRVNTKSLIYSNPQKQINNLLLLIGYPKITTSIFRKTRSSILMRAFEDVFVVAEGNNHSIKTASKSYLNGNPESHEMKIASAFHAQKLISEGSPKEQSVNDAIFKFKDPFTMDEWKKKGQATPNKTPTGIRCTDPFGEKAKKSLRSLRTLEISDSDTCIDFLGCFECEHHALIAEKDDIWLMLSFKDTILEALSRPSFNSVPTDSLSKTLNTVNSILDKYKNKAAGEYSLAKELNKDMPHPLYDDESSLTDLLDLYK
jgi:hypothetical protein